MVNPEETSEHIEKKALKRGKKEMGFVRVRLALERLQLAWLRTAITFIALGFTSYKFYNERIEEGQEPILPYFNGRGIGIFLILVGFLGLVQGTLQHRKNTAKLKALYPAMPYSVSLVQSYFILVFTFLLFLFVIVKL